MWPSSQHCPGDPVRFCRLDALMLASNNTGLVNIMRYVTKHSLQDSLAASGENFPLFLHLGGTGWSGESQGSVGQIPDFTCSPAFPLSHAEGAVLCRVGARFYPVAKEQSERGRFSNYRRQSTATNGHLLSVSTSSEE